MQTTNIRHKLHIHCSKVALLFMILLMNVFYSSAQHKPSDNRAMNLPNYDDRLFHYGFTIAFNNARYNITHSDWYVQNRDSIISINSKPITGLTLGFVINMRVAHNLDLRLLPNVLLTSRAVEYEFRSQTLKQETEWNEIQLPILLKYKSNRQKNFRAYVLAGINPGIQVTSNKKINTGEKDIRIEDTNFAIDYGFGLDIYNPMFKFSPEIRFSHGLTNVLVKNDPNVFSKSLNGLTTHTVTLYFHFE